VKRDMVVRCWELELLELVRLDWQVLEQRGTVDNNNLLYLKSHHPFILQNKLDQVTCLTLLPTEAITSLLRSLLLSIPLLLLIQETVTLHLDLNILTHL